MINMVASGESSGELDQMLARTGQMQENMLKASIASMLSVFQPMLILTMAGIVLIIVMAIMLPMIQMNNLV
jgi:general secretion pathway protein F